MRDFCIGAPINQENENHAHSQYGFGVCLAGLNRHKDAIVELRKVVPKLPMFAPAHAALASSLHALGDDESLVQAAASYKYVCLDD